MKKSLYRARHALRAIAAAWFAAALVFAADGFRPNERAFLEKALESMRQQMRLADVGLNQTRSSDVRSHALQMASDYRDLNESLQALVQRRGGLAGAPVGGSSETYQKLTARSGTDFDREYVRIAGELSDSVMALFEQMVNNAKDPELRELASAQLPMLRDHQNRALELRKSLE